MSPALRSLRAKIAANTRWAGENPHDPDGPLPRARAAFEARFYDQVDPDRTLSEEERNRRAECARRAYFQRLAFASARARRRGKTTDHDRP